jgi:uncharacterized protein
MASALIFVVRGYQVLVAPVLPPNTCRFYPTCSNYAIDALKKYGALKGTLATLRRISKCHPWHGGGFDPA